MNRPMNFTTTDAGLDATADELAATAAVEAAE